MIEVTENLWLLRGIGYEAVITTNGSVRKDGQAVMGRGCARQARERFPELAWLLGNAITHLGNHVHYFPDEGINIISFPVKHEWWDKADVALIRRSVEELVSLVDAAELQKVVMPRPGCGNGRLSWWHQVRPLLVDKLDNRFTVCDLGR